MVRFDMISHRTTERAKARFWSKVHKTDTCWNWLGKKTFGYGALMVGTKVVRAHRLSYEWAHGPIPAGYMICHRCDNPSCVRPDHLFAGTAADNVSDKVAKGRHPQGEHSCKSVLSENEARLIIRAYYRGGVSQKALATTFGVARTAVCRLVNGRRWPHLRAELSKHRNRTGRQNAGLLHATITPATARAIFDAHRTAPIKAIAERFNVTPKIVNSIVHGERWNHVTGLPKKPRRYRVKS
jgi:plasmid maintenance system antidote protein VapI